MSASAPDGNLADLLTLEGCEDAGSRAYDMVRELYPICRSITGAGVRETLARVGRRIPLELYEVPSGTPVFDWEVPPEWSIRDAYVKSADGRRVVDFREHNLHVVSYSEPVRATMSLEALRPHLHSLPEAPDRIPYRTSYYRRNWGFCLRHRDLLALPEADYEVCIDSDLKAGSLTYAECFLPGRVSGEIIVFTHVCHPSLANDNASGIAVACELAAALSRSPRKYGYRFVFSPGTIGAITWLARNETSVGRIAHGLVIGLMGDPGPLTYKRSAQGGASVDRAAAHVVRSLDARSRIEDFSPYGYDERQFCSPGFNLPVGRLTRSANGAYPEYHTSGDDLDLVQPRYLAHSVCAAAQIFQALDADECYLNTQPKCEAQLGKRGLYRATGGVSPSGREHALLWILNQSDGHRSLLDIAERAGMPFTVIRSAADELLHAGLLRAAEIRSEPS
jgi:aminopeptidase-like protein